MATVIYPTLATLNNSKNITAFKKTLTQSLSAMVFLTISIMAGMIILAEPMVAFVYQRGVFDEQPPLGQALLFAFSPWGCLAMPSIC